MLEIAKTFLLAPSPIKWRDYDSSFREFFTGLDTTFDRLVDLIDQFYAERRAVPNLDALVRLMGDANDPELLDYVRRVVEDPAIGAYADDLSFGAGLETLKKETLLNTVRNAVRGWETALATSRGLYIDKAEELTRKMLSEGHQALSRLRNARERTALRMHGEEAMQRMRDRYTHIKERREGGDTIYYTVPFQAFRDVHIAPGDLVTIVGYTSQCKSVYARELAYKLLIEDGRNVGVWSTEMPGEDVENVFALRHANNKLIFPGTPKIPFMAWKTGTMTEEQEDFFFYAHKDLVKAEHYGSLIVSEPDSLDFNMGDLANRCAEIEDTFMPLNVVLVDYLAQLNPLPHGVRSRGDTRMDVNAMFREFRRFGMHYRHLDGTKAPLILITPAQISRGKYNEALKNDKMYDADAASDFNEIERSSPIMFSVLMDRQMRAEGRLRLQCLKNRMGEVPVDAYEVYADLAHGMGLYEYEQSDANDLPDRIAELDSMTWGQAAALL